MRYVLPILLLALAGCGSDVSPAVEANGRPGYQFRCGGLFGSGMDCALQATRYCPYGYYPVVESSSRLVAVCAAADTRAVAAERPAEQAASVAEPAAPVTETSGDPAGTYAGAGSAAASLTAPVRSAAPDPAPSSQPLTQAEKDELFRNFDAYLANQSGRHPRAH